MNDQKKQQIVNLIQVRRKEEEVLIGLFSSEDEKQNARIVPTVKNDSNDSNNELFKYVNKLAVSVRQMGEKIKQVEKTQEELADAAKLMQKALNTVYEKGEENTKKLIEDLVFKSPEFSFLREIISEIKESKKQAAEDNEQTEE